MNEKLTGAVRYRPSFFGKLILQVEYTKDADCDEPLHWHSYKRWRDAKMEDLSFVKASDQPK